ncbi:hypothetical protein [Bdellovibrio sp. HCB2-146]|uniref:hypothetical protein n=1 Tax=Bdellovibrio sp. HCB2-146 TaxID=3394362 RepID=UPI0039BC34A8
MKQMAFLMQILNRAHLGKLGSRLTNLRMLFACLLSVSFWITACNPSGSTQNYYNTTQNTAGSPGQTSMSGGGGATGDGGGGQGVQCGDILYVRDIYEAKINNNKKMKVISSAQNTEEVSKEAIQVLVSSLKQYFGAASINLDFTKEQFWFEFIKKISFLNNDKMLVASQDANSPIALQKECQLVQIAYWDESAGKSEDGTLYVNKALWNKLDQLNKVALLAHEFFFKHARRASYKNSDTVRHKVGLLLSEQGLTPLFSKWEPSQDKNLSSILPKKKAGFKYCEGSTTEDPSAKLQLYQYEGSDKLQHIVIPQISSASINADLLQGSEIIFDPLSNKQLDIASELLLYQTIVARETYNVAYEFALIPYTEWTWMDRWFSESLRDPSHNLEDLLNSAQKSRSNQLLSHSKSSPEMISISLENTLSGWQLFSDKKAKTKDELIAEVHRKIRANVNEYCTVGPESIDRAISTLHYEIDTAISAGTYPDKFPKWENALTALWNSSNANSPKNPHTMCGELNRDLLLKKYPFFLFKVKINNYDENDIKRTLNLSGFYPQMAKPIPRAKLKVQQATSGLEFYLTCKDYNDIFTTHTKRTAKTENPRFVSNKVVRNHFTGYPSGATSQKDIQAVKLLSETLEFKDGELGFQAFLTAPREGFIREDNAFGIPEADFSDFISDLYEAKELDINACTVNHRPKEDYRNQNTESNCVVITMPQSNSKYLYYFLDLPGHHSLLQLVRRVSAE